jgi:hypothetical protein
MVTSTSAMHTKKVIQMMETALVSHQQWAEHFEKYPEIERNYVNSGEWDDAKTHREYVEAYRCVLNKLRNHSS